jgi:hypothetical protein
LYVCVLHQVLEKLRVGAVAREEEINDLLRRDIVRQWSACWEGPRAKAKCPKGALLLSENTRHVLTQMRCK